MFFLRGLRILIDVMEWEPWLAGTRSGNKMLYLRLMQDRKRFRHLLMVEPHDNVPIDNHGTRSLKSTTKSLRRST
jgi:hypothetical protein